MNYYPVDSNVPLPADAFKRQTKTAVLTVYKDQPIEPWVLGKDAEHVELSLEPSGVQGSLVLTNDEAEYLGILLVESAKFNRSQPFNGLDTVQVSTLDLTYTSANA
jgi:hypothetical protein